MDREEGKRIRKDTSGGVVIHRGLDVPLHPVGFLVDREQLSIGGLRHTSTCIRLGHHLNHVLPSRLQSTDRTPQLKLSTHSSPLALQFLTPDPAKSRCADPRNSSALTTFEPNSSS